MFNTLTEKLNAAFHVLKGHGKITEINVAETLKEVRRALLDADVSFKIAKEFTQRVKEKSIGKNVLTDLRPGQLMVKIVKDELTQLMGGEHEGINLSDNPSIILLSGLQGSGKTTSSLEITPVRSPSSMSSELEHEERTMVSNTIAKSREVKNERACWQKIIIFFNDVLLAIIIAPKYKSLDHDSRTLRD